MFDFGCRPCAEDVQVGCSVTLEGELVSIETFVSGSSGGSDCASGGDGDGYTCDDVYAQCDSPALPEGQYQVVHGDQVLDIEVPSTVAGACSRSSANTVCCLEHAQCRFFETCADNECTPMDCDTTTRCPC